MIKKYLNEIFKKAKTGDASERSYYPVLEALLKEFPQDFKKHSVLVESRNSVVGIPDFKVETPKGLLIGYLEAKDLGRDLDKLSKSENTQIEKYLKEYPKLIITNFIEFRLYENREKVDSVTISQPITLRLQTPVLANEGRFKGLLERFYSTTIPKVYTSKKLAELLAHKTHVIRDLMLEEIDLEDDITTSTEELLTTFRKTLRPQMKIEDFADMYAQTITFGLFVARINSQRKEFNRKTAYHYIPQTIPLLRRLFWVISGQDLPQHIEWQVDEIAEILANTSIKKIKEQFFAEGKGRDPIIHFYETFLAEYDPKEREKRGVYYTPEPVVSYITKSIHKLLKEKFDKPDGFADPSVLVLDPAAGTLTFPAKAIALSKEEFSKKYGEGGWSSLVKDHILKNFYAFELLMAPYAVGHLKISLLLQELGYKLKKDDRFKLYLTNTLEMEKLAPQPLLLAPEISKESEAAYEVKEKKPILTIFGNPPYSGVSENKGKWILKRIEEYKQIKGKSLGERNPKWIQDDYVKFFRFAQWKIEKRGVGILGFITNHAWLDNPTFRGMRYSLLQTFDEIYILNLHGSVLKKERTPRGKKDENVFDIQPGVTIAILVKNDKAKEKRVHYSDLWGLREAKYKWLEAHHITNTRWQDISPSDPYYFFVPKEEKGWKLYKNYWKVTDIFPVNSIGIVTARDRFVIDLDKQSLETRIRIFRDSRESDEFIKNAYKLKDKPTFRWHVKSSRQELRETKNWEDYFTRLLYRPFDERWIYYHPAVIERRRENVMKHMLRSNLALLAKRQQKQKFSYAFVSDEIAESSVFESAYANNTVFPLYLYNDSKQQQISLLLQERQTATNKKPNISQKLFNALGNTFNKKPSPDEFFYYIYAILYSNIYRDKYQEFLRIDFPRIPFTKDYKLFQKLGDLGGKLVELHLLKAKELNRPIAKFPVKNSREVKKREYKEKEKRIYINDSQYFEGIEPDVWNYFIGGYQVLDKWLKDRKGRSLSYEDIKHYCKVVTALSKTLKIQEKVDKFYPEVEKSLIKFKGGKRNG